MVQKKLNFNQPILSVRRYSLQTDSQIVDQRKESNALPMLPSHRPESNSDPVRNPGSVPFIWEQTPGQPKQEILAQSSSELQPNHMEALQEIRWDPDHESSISSKATDSADCSEEFVVDGLDSLHETHDLGAVSSKPKNEEQGQRKKVVYQDKAILLHCRPSFEKRNYFYCKEKEGSSDDGGERHENVITVCCLLPRSCLKSSICNLNLDHATRVMDRVMTFPLSHSSTDSENEYAVKPVDKMEAFLEETPSKKNYVTLEELLLADKEWPKEKRNYIDTVEKVEREDDDESDIIKTGDEMKMVEDSNSDRDWSSEDEEEEDIRVAVSKAAENARKKQQLSRATTLGSVVPTPPLPPSPSDSWLFRTLSSASTRKASSSTVMSRFSSDTEKYRLC